MKLKTSMMFASVVSSSNHFKSAVLCLLISAVLGCSNQINSVVRVSPKNFKIQAPLIFNDRGIIIRTNWGSNKTPHLLCLDNYSPSWIKSKLIAYNKSFVKHKEYSFNTTTADGTAVEGEIGICDSLSFENLAFTNAPFYVMPYNAKDNISDDGVFGTELMSKGVWKIDFKRNELTFASTIDSLQEINQAKIFPSIFKEQSIKIDVRFGNNVVERMGVDLGYNGYMLLPLNDFNKIRESKTTISRFSKLSTPASSTIINRLIIADTVYINHNWFFAVVSSNESVKERLIGLQFFRRFDYVIFDFINKRIYIPKKVW